MEREVPGIRGWRWSRGGCYVGIRVFEVDVRDVKISLESCTLKQVREEVVEGEMKGASLVESQA